jgi:hypothetical protein
MSANRCGYRFSALVACAVLSAAAAPARAAIIWVSPSGDASGQSDGNALRAAIAKARRGDTVHLRTGNYYLGRIGPTNNVPIRGSKGTNWFVADWVGRPPGADGYDFPTLDPTSNQSVASWVLYDAPGAPQGLQFGRDLSLTSFDESIGTEKDGITILGDPGAVITSPRGPASWHLEWVAVLVERDADGTVIYDDNGNAFPIVDANGRPQLDPKGPDDDWGNVVSFVYAGGGFLGSLVINSRDVTLKGLTFSNMVWPIVAVAPGFSIEDCTVTNSGHGVVALLDAAQTMPNSPSLDGMKRSAIRGGSYTADNPLQVFGSGVTVAGSVLTHQTGLFGNIIGPGDSLNTTSVLDLSHADYNVITGVKLTGDGQNGGLYVNPSENPGTANHNAIVNCTIAHGGAGSVIVRQYDDHVGTPLAGLHQTTGNVVAGNLFHQSAAVRIEAWGGGVIQGNSVLFNRFEQTTAPPGINVAYYSAVALLGRGGEVVDNVVAYNDYRASGLLGWIYDLSDWRHPSQYGDLILLGPGVHDNHVSESAFAAGTGLCQQLWDLGADVFGDPVGRNDIAGQAACWK